MEQNAQVSRGPGRLLPQSFYEMRPEVVAPQLLGKVLLRRVKGRKPLVGRIVEVEAYLGPHNDPPDPAAHAHRGQTARNAVLFGLAGHAYVYSIYGLYYCLNVSCELEGKAGCVLIRALEPLAGFEQMAENRSLPAVVPHTPVFLRQLTSGPSRICQAMNITREEHNGVDVTKAVSPLQIRDDGFAVAEAMVTTRIGIREAADRPLRYVIPGHFCVSGPRTFTGKRVPIP